MGKIAVYGAGGFAREVAWLVQECRQHRAGLEVVCFIDDDESTHGSTINNIPSMGLREAKSCYPEARIVGGTGSPAMRELMMGKAAAAGFEFDTIIHPSVQSSEWVEVGSGSVICAGNILTTNIRLGNHVQINLACTVGHDVVMEDYATLAPGAHISGCVHLGKRVYVGTGAVIINGTSDAPIVVEDDAVIGAGACVTRSVSSRYTVVGVPAKPIYRS